ncbi:MAG: polysaccharide biosynthesis/export family protein [Thermoguttaceae bacterium]
MLTSTFVRRTLLTIVLTAGLGCAGDVFGADVKTEVKAATAPAGSAPEAQAAEKTKAGAADLPRELSMRPLSAYRVQPPDILQVEMLKMVLLPSYRIEVYDVLQIQMDKYIDNAYLVDWDGTVNLGSTYGKVRVVGMSIEAVEEAFRKHLSQVLQQSKVSVQLARTGGTQPVTGQYLVGPDGTINLRAYGVVKVSGKTVSEIKTALQRQLSQFFNSPELSVDVSGYNSQVYYIITDGAGLGDNVRRIPITGSETVLDAVAAIGGRSQLSSKKMWIARPSPSDPENGTILTVDYDAITHRGATATNYQIMPGDRIFIAEDSLVALNNEIGKMTAPAERILGIISLGTSSVEGFGIILPK